MDDDGDRPSRACGHDTPPAREFSQPPDPGAGRWTDGLGSLNESRRPWCFRQQFWRPYVWHWLLSLRAHPTRIIAHLARTTE
jgi:hypothetical protein